MSTFWWTFSFIKHTVKPDYIELGYIKLLLISNFWHILCKPHNKVYEFEPHISNITRRRYWVHQTPSWWNRVWAECEKDCARGKEGDGMKANKKERKKRQRGERVLMVSWPSRANDMGWPPLARTYALGQKLNKLSCSIWWRCGSTPCICQLLTWWTRTRERTWHLWQNFKYFNVSRQPVNAAGRSTCSV